MPKDTSLSAGALLKDVRAQSPLIHNITNYVVMNFTANSLLAIGASPVMAHAEEEVDEMTGLASALVVNIGTLSAPWIKSMKQAIRAAHKKGIPVVFDPVGAGATRLRTETSQCIVRELKPSIIRGNASEILAIAGKSQHTKGVDSTHDSREVVEIAKAFARENGCTVCVSGAVDCITDGSRVALVKNGHPWMSKVTGMGCAATALIGATSAVHPDLFSSTAAAMTLMGVCGELAAQGAPGTGSFQVRFIDQLFQIQQEQVDALGRVEMLA